MALDQSALLELSEALQSADAGELMRTLLTTIVQALVEAEASAHVGADRHQRTEARTTQRNGHRPKAVSTTAGYLTVKIPQVRTVSFFPRCSSPAGGSTWRPARGDAGLRRGRVDPPGR